MFNALVEEGEWPDVHVMKALSLTLDGFVDRHDEVVYAAARQRFADDLKRVGTCGRLPGAS